MRIHIVKEGDTLYFLSKKYNVSLEKIISANPEIANPNQLTIGTKVKIPSAPVTTHPGGSILHQHKVVQGDSLWKLSKAWGVSLQDMIASNPQLKNPNALIIGETVFIPSGSSSAPNVTTTENLQEGNLVPPATGSQAHTGKKNTAPMPNYPQLPELPEMPEMPVLPKAEITKPKPPKAEITKPKPIPPKEEITKPKPEPPKEEVKKPIEPAPKPELKPIPLPPSKPLPLPVPKPEMIKPVPLPVPIPPTKKPEYEPKKEEYYSKKEDCNNEYMNPYQNPVYDKGMYGGNVGYQGYQNPYQQPMGYVNDKKQGYPQPMPYTQQPQSVQNAPYQSGKSGDVSQQPYTTYEHGGYIVNYALVDVPSYGGDCGCGHAKPLPYSYMQAEADWKAATAQNAQPMLHPQAYGHSPQYTNYFRPTEYGVQPPYYHPNYPNDYGQTSFQAEATQTSSQNGAEVQQEPIVDLNGLNQLPILEEEKTVQKNKTISKSNKAKKAAVSSNKRNKAPSNNSQASRQGRARKERRNPWIKR